MSRLLRRILVSAAALAGLFAVANACTLVATTGGFVKERSFLVPLAGAAFCAWAALRWKTPAQFRLALLLVLVAGAEVVLDAAGWLGVLPGIATKEKCAFGRVYWRAEGHGNAIRNRDGWHFPAFNRSAPRRVAVIGDSFVEAVEVKPSNIHAALLQSRLRAAGQDVAIDAFGNHGTSPAFHFDVIDYAARHFQPQEIILVLYLGNDLSEMTPQTSGHPPERFVYYEFDPAHQLRLTPASAAARDGFRQGLEFSHRPLLLQAPAILRSHSMLVQSVNSIRGRLEQRRTVEARVAAAGAEVRDQVRLGLNPAPFADPPTPLSRECLDLLLAELDLCASACQRAGCSLRLVTIPAFPASFYRTQKGSEWTVKLDGFDYLRPEREIAAHAAARGWPCLVLGAQMQRDRLDVETIHGFYFSDGVGHFTEAGHRYCADAMFDAFFR